MTRCSGRQATTTCSACSATTRSTAATATIGCSAGRATTRYWAAAAVTGGSSSVGYGDPALVPGSRSILMRSGLRLGEEEAGNEADDVDGGADNRGRCCEFHGGKLVGH